MGDSVKFFRVLLASLLLASFLGSAAQAAPAKKVEGTINRYDQYKIVLSVDNKDFIIAIDGRRTKITGRPAVGKVATVWYVTNSHGTLYATNIDVPQVAKPNPHANADDPKAATLVGTLTAVSNDRITLRANGQQYKIMLDGQKTKVTGRMAVAKQATVVYKRHDGNLWAMSIDVPRGTANPNANADDPAEGSLVGTFTQVSDNRVTIRANGKEYKVMLDNKRTRLLGHPVVSKNGTVWYRKYKGNLWATKIAIDPEHK